ncbi:MAG TPA: hypothetical protein VGD89_01375 [Flavipsychrobacter sp.]
MKRMLLVFIALFAFAETTFSQTVRYLVQNTTSCFQGPVTIYAACKGSCTPTYYVTYSPLGAPPGTATVTYNEGGAGLWYPSDPPCEEIEIVAVDIMDCTNHLVTYQIGNPACGYSPTISMFCPECGNKTVYVDFQKVYYGPPPSSPYDWIINFHY